MQPVLFIASVLFTLASSIPFNLENGAISYSPEISHVLQTTAAKFIPPRRNLNRGANGPFDLIDATLLVRTQSGWLRGDLSPIDNEYPASCVKLAHLVAAVHWCNESGKSPDCLDVYTRPMITVSSNVASQQVVSAITGAPNRKFSGYDSEFFAWAVKRNYTQRLFDSMGLLGNQHFMNPTYDSSPVDGEAMLREYYGQNMMQTGLTAMLMLGIINGSIEPQARAYMLELMTRPRFDGAVGFGLPPSTVFIDKPGGAYNKTNDIAFIALPNGVEIIASITSDGLELPLFAKPQAPADGTAAVAYGGSAIGTYLDEVLHALRLLDDIPEVVTKSADASVKKTGEWSTRASTLSFDGHFLSSSSPNASVVLPLHVARKGKYEVSLWFVQEDDACDAVETIVTHSDGNSSTKVNMRVNGSRWVYVGIFDLMPGAAAVALSGCGVARINADSVRAVAVLNVN